MATVTQYLFQVWDEKEEKLDIPLRKNDLVVLSLRENSFRGQGTFGFFQGIEEKADDGFGYVILEIADRIAGYDMPTLRTKLARFRVKDIKLIQLLARNSSAAAILFEKIGEAHARNADLTTRIKNAAQALNVITEGGKIILR